MLTKQRYDYLAEKLEKNEEVQFTDGDTLVHISWSDEEAGWMVDTWDINKCDIWGGTDSFDGGLCTGSERDAVEFYDKGTVVLIAVPLMDIPTGGH